jgi:hypothetical protein
MTEPKTKVPSQFYQWIESFKQGYENSINKVFNRVEAVNEDHKEQIKTVYQTQIDSLKKTYQEHLHSLKENHQSQVDESQSRIRQLEKDARFYQEQLKRQHQTIDKINGRYDAIIFALTDKMDNKELRNVIRDISPENDDKNQPSLQYIDTPQERFNGPLASVNTEQQPEPEQTPAAKQSPKTEQTPPSTPKAIKTTEDYLQQAFDARQAQCFDEAYQLFLIAAQAGNSKAMGAIGRAHFVGEGTFKDKPTGLAWLIVAAEHDFEPAVNKIAAAKAKSEDLYQAALKISTDLMTKTEK